MILHLPGAQSLGVPPRPQCTTSISFSLGARVWCPHYSKEMGVLTCKLHQPLLAVAAAAGPTNFGATAEAATPWLHLALYTAMGTGPLSVVLVCGQRIWRLPPQLAGCTHVLIWPWDMDAVRAQVPPAPG